VKKLRKQGDKEEGDFTQREAHVMRWCTGKSPFGRGTQREQQRAPSSTGNKKLDEKGGGSREKSRKGKIKPPQISSHCCLG
jgi:hypothetical protein